MPIYDDLFAGVTRLKHASDPTKTLELTWASLGAFIVFWCYGLFGALTSIRMPYAQLAISFGLAGIFYALVGPLACHRPTIKISISRRDLAIFGAVSLALVALNYNRLAAPFTSDSLLHTQQSLVHIKIFLLKFHALDSALDNFEMRHLLQIGLLAAIASTGLAIAWIRKHSSVTRGLIATAVFLLLRAGVYLGGGNPDPHPSLRLLPYWLSGGILGPYYWAYRIAHLLIMAAFLTWLFQKLRGRLQTVTLILFIATLATIPLLREVTTLVEPSIWSFLIFSVFLFKTTPLSEREAAGDDVIASLALTLLMRSSSLFLLLPLGIYWLLPWDRPKKSFWEQMRSSSPIILMTIAALMFLGQSIVGGPASMADEHLIPLWTVEPKGIARVIYALRAGFITKVIWNSLGPYSLMIPLGGAFLWLRSRTNALIVFMAFTLAVAMFFVIAPHLWGLPRYVAEYALPLAIIGLLSLCVWLPQMLAKGFLMALIAFNLWSYSRINAINTAPDQWRSATQHLDDRIRTEVPFPVREALKFLKDTGNAGRNFNASISYGTFAETLSGWSLNEVAITQDLLKRVYQDHSVLIARYAPQPSLKQVETSNVNTLLFADHPENRLEQEVNASTHWVSLKQTRRSDSGAETRIYIRQIQH